MGWRLGVVLFAPLFLFVGEFSVAADAVTGTATFRERIALPAQAVFEAVLEDVSVADAAALEVARVRQEDAGGPPFEFAIAFAPDEIVESNSYSVRAEVTVGGEVMFASMDAYPVITGGAPLHLDMMLKRVSHDDKPAIDEVGVASPARFSGTLPCPDCEGLRYQLNLWPDGVFHMRRSWRGTDREQDNIGRWSQDIGKRRLTLTSGGDKHDFLIEGGDRIRPLDAQGEPYDAGEDGVLIQADEMKPLNPHALMRGMVRYAADRAEFTECETGRRYKLLMESDFQTLEEAYLAAGVARGKEIIASFDGTILNESEDARGQGDVVVRVDEFTGIWPDETCEPSVTEAALTNTYWKLLRIGDVEIVPADEGKEPHLTLNEAEGRYAATVGCNNLIGGFESTETTLTFGMGATTMMACPPPLDEWERLFVQALSATAGWRIDGQALELLDAEGESLGSFEAVYLR